MPPNEPREPTRRTRHVRVSEDLAEKLGEILEAEGGTATDFLDPLIRSEIEARHTANLPAITLMRKARADAKRLRDELPELANDLGGESGA